MISDFFVLTTDTIEWHLPSLSLVSSIADLDGYYIHYQTDDQWLKNLKIFNSFYLGLRELPYFIGYCRFRLIIHGLVTGNYFDVVIAGVIGLNVITMSLEYYQMPKVKF